MGYEIDHIFVLTDAGAPAADALLQLGFTEGPPSRHEGQGTANRRFFFDNAMLELLWVESVEDASGPVARPLLLAERWIGRSNSASPFGICLRPNNAQTILPPFECYEYRPSYFPEGLVAHIGQGTPLSEPLWFFMAHSRRSQASPLKPHPAPEHRIGVSSITEVTITLPGTPSPITNAAAAACGVEVRERGTVLGTVKAWPGDADVVESQAQRPALTVPARDAPHDVRAGTKERPHGTNKGTAPIRRER